ncbi:MAG: orotidine-5'-phosphate decarboxylase [Acidimicrobiia bacterium]|nr:orotidine-5'-phosphate decarboxylase [Acidimicrobiia bacterium]
MVSSLADPPILVALDVPNAEEAVRLAKAVSGSVGGFKIGLELLMGPGPGLVGVLDQLGKPVFVDAKLHDIPHTVGRAAKQLGMAGARWVTVHAAGGAEMLEAAVEGLAAGARGRQAGILAITVLTSLDDAMLAHSGIPVSAGKLTSKRSKLAAEAEVEGVVCSVKELGVVSDVAPSLIKVTPGIRPEGEDPGDQQRIATPEEAMRRGADLLVIGRPITRAADPRTAAEAIAARLEEAKSKTRD